MKAVSDKYSSKILLPTEACYELSVKDANDETASFLTDGTWSRGEYCVAPPRMHAVATSMPLRRMLPTPFGPKRYAAAVQVKGTLRTSWAI